jgi:N-acetylated-alpha-linked acidic dipeptidase
MRVERDLLDPSGIPGRPWYRHLIFAPKFTYAPEVLPGVAEAVRTGDPARIAGAIRALTNALQRAADTLRKG